MYFYLPYVIIVIFAVIMTARGEKISDRNKLYQLGTGLALMLIVRDLMSIAGFT